MQDTRNYYEREIDQIDFAGEHPAKILIGSEGKSTRTLDINRESAAALVAKLCSVFFVDLTLANTMKPAPTADDIKHELKDARYADGRNAWPSAEAMTRDISAELRRRGIPHAPAQYDAGGNCLTCGEGGRCPGVHTFEEIQQAARAVKGK